MNPDPGGADDEVVERRKSVGRGRARVRPLSAASATSSGSSLSLGTDRSASSTSIHALLSGASSAGSQVRSHLTFY